MRQILILCCLLASSALAAQEQGKPATDNGFLGDRERGWHFYEPEQKPVPRKPILPPRPQPGGAPAEATDPEAPVMGTAWLRDNLPKYADRAIDNPTEDNIKLYYYMVRLMNDRAYAFQSAVERVMDDTPSLDERQRVPTTPYANSAFRRSVDAKIREILARIVSRAGLMYFYRSDCPFCMKQSSALRGLMNKHGIEVMAISIDGLPMPDGSFPEWTPDQGQAEQLGIEVTPSFMFAVPETGQILKLAAGLQTVPQLEDRLIDIAEKLDWITEDELIAIRRATSDFIQEQMPTGATPDDPRALLAILEAAGKAAGGTPLGTTPIAPSQQLGVPQ